MKNLNLNSIVFLERFDGSIYETNVISIVSRHFYEIYRNSLENFNACYGYCKKGEKSFPIKNANENDYIRQSAIVKNEYCTFFYKYEYLIVDEKGNVLEPYLLISLYKNSNDYYKKISKFNKVKNGKKNKLRKYKDRNFLKRDLKSATNSIENNVKPRAKLTLGLKSRGKHY